MRGTDSSTRNRGRRTTLVTGGAGFIGTHLTETLLARGDDVYVVDNFITGERENVLAFLEHDRYHFSQLDITTPAFLAEYATIPFGQIFHLACPTGVPNIEKLSMEMLFACSVGTLNVMEVARAQGATVLFTSSCEVYGEPLVSPQTDCYTGNVNPTGPRCAYEEGKRFSESTVATYVRKYGIDAKIVRIFNTYGPGMSRRDERVLPRFLRSIQKGEPLTIYGNGSQQRTFLYIEDLIQALLLVIEEGETGEVYNIGGTEPVSIRDLASLVIAMTSHSTGVQFLPHFTEDHSQRLPDTAKLAALGWRQQVSLTQGLRQMIEAYGIGTAQKVTAEEEALTVALL